MNEIKKKKLNPWLTAGGFSLLIYAVLGNYFALPGYIRFLERGGTSAAGNTFDISVVIGATKTILWMYSFQLGVLSFAIAHSLREKLHTKYIIVLGIIWLMAWSWPTLPAPGRWFYILFGGIILLIITLRLLQFNQGQSSRLSKTLLLGAIVFFAFATWEVCGLGSTGRMLHPEQSAKPLAHNILVTQSTKLMFEFLFAWGLLLLSSTLSQKAVIEK
jgi:hypothetical protein